MASLDELSTALINADKAGDTDAAKALANEIIRIKGATPATPKPSTSAVAINAGNQAIAGIPDALLNAPNRLMNLGRAAYGTAATALGRPDLAPNLTPDPNYVSNAFERAGLINQSAAPQTTGQRLLAAGVGGAVGGALAPAGSVPALLSNVGSNALSGVIGQGTTEATGNPMLGMAANIASVPVVSAGMNVAGNYGRQQAREAQVRQQQNTVRDQTLNEAQDAGYVVPPSAVNRSFVGNRLESIAGKAAVGQEAANRNQSVTNALARKEAGLPESAAISEQALEAVRNKASAPYREIAALDPAAATALDDLKQARFNANSYFRHYDVSADPQSLAKAKVYAADASNLENSIDQMAIKAGRPDLLAQLQTARQQIAKTYDVERALNVATGDVSARILGRAVDKGKPLSGGLATAGKFAEAFPSYAREGANIPTPGVSKSEAILSLLAGLGGHAAFGPAGVALAAAPLVSGPTRSMLLSGTYQSRFAQPNYSAGILGQLAPMQTTDPALRALYAGALYPQQ